MSATVEAQTVTTDREVEDHTIGWATWKGKSLHSKSVHATKESLLIGYDLMTLRGLGSTEESLLSHGIECSRTEVTLGPRPRPPYGLAIGGRIVPEALSWSCTSDHPERVRMSACGFLDREREGVSLAFTDLEKDAIDRFNGFEIDYNSPCLTRVKDKRKQAAYDALRQRVLAAFSRHGIEVVPLTFRKLPTEPSIPPFVCPPGYTIKKRFKIKLDELVRPGFRYYVCFEHLEVFAAMARTAVPAPHGDSGAIELLSCSSCINSRSIAPFSGKEWREDLARRFHNVLLSHLHEGWPSHAWREANGIRLGADFLVNWPTAELEEGEYWSHRNTPGDKVDRLLTEHGWLAWSLNTSHPHANRIHAVRLHFGTGGARIDLEYGYPYDSSSWYHDLAYQRPGEPLLFTIERALAELAKLKDPDAKPPVLDTGAQIRVAKPAREARTERPKWDPQRWMDEFRWSAEFDEKRKGESEW